MTRGVKKENLPTKVCVVCDRPFTWRKKWEQCWDEVTTCSKSCNAKRKKAKGTAGAGNDGEEDDVDGARSENEGDSHGASNADAKNDQRKANKKAVKAAKRAKRGADAVSDGEGDDTAVNDGSKPCDLCSKHVDFLIRCRVDSTKQWKMACGRCWKRASGGVPDGDAEHPHYRYGGLWKNSRANSDAGVKSGWKKGGKRLDRKGKENANKSDDETNDNDGVNVTADDLAVLTEELSIAL